MKTLLLIAIACVSGLYAQTPLQELKERIEYLREHNDRSHFFLSAASEDQPVNNRHTKVHFIVTDSQGRRAGFESLFLSKRGSLRVNSYREIPNAAYGVDQASSLDPSIVPHEPESATLNMFPPVLTDTYTIQFVGLDNCKFHASMCIDDISGEAGKTEQFEAYITSGSTQQYILHLDPTPGTPAPVIIKNVTFDVLRNDLSVAQTLNQLGDEKFTLSLVRNIDQAEKLSTKCDKRKPNKDKACEPAVAVLELVIKRLEKASQKCDGKKPQACDEDKDWDDFGKGHRKDRDYDDFFREWDRDAWHKDKKECKRFVSDEALKIITEDAQWLINP